MINRTKLFNGIRVNLFHTLSQSQVDGINHVLDEWEKQQLTDIRWLAYILATCYHETAKTMQPVEEIGKGKGRPYGEKKKMGGGPGKRIPYTTPDKIFYGRGHTQNTWYENYEALTHACGGKWDFLNHPELLLQMEPSIWATFYAMQSGLYTGKKLKDYFNTITEDWTNARKIINGQDCANLIAGYARQFYGALN